MLISRIKKIENIIPVNDRPFKDISDTQLREKAFRSRLYLCSAIKDKEVAREYKKLFIDNPTLFEMMTQTEKNNEEMLALLEGQRDWEIKHADLQKLRDEDIFKKYEITIKQYKFFKKL
jgi:hypothetical protein